MPEIVLELGPVTFSAFEIPAGIRFGGRQIMAVHQLTDGRRIIDSIGASDSELSFSGAFSGPTATLRARLLNSLRAAGAELTLSWDIFCYTVVVSTFDAEYENAAWIPYHLSCTVLRDDAAPVLTSAPSLSTTVISDLTVAAAQCGTTGVDFSGVQATLAAADATTLGSAAYAAAQSAIVGAQSAITFKIAEAEAVVVSTVLSDETSPVSLANDVLSVTAAAQQLAGLIFGNSYVGRACRNLQNASP
ncbi:MAG TPA: hypothetical protein VMU81_24575 [Acetobacteraceae bacterium]|nr:hypothetical protein [Acetobacteraceae bacterium]